MNTAIETKNIVIQGVNFRVEAFHDSDTRPEHADDCYNEEDIQAWKDDKWEFVELTITPVVDGVDITSATSYASGFYEYGSMPGKDKYLDLDSVLEYVLPDHRDEWLAKLKEELPALRQALGDTAERLSAR